MKAARRRINSGPTKNFFRLRTHNDNIIQSELLIVNVTGHMCVLCASASCGMMVVGIVCVGATATGHESKRNSLA